jgi:thioredoxin reductase
LLLTVSGFTSFKADKKLQESILISVFLCQNSCNQCHDMKDNLRMKQTHRLESISFFLQVLWNSVVVEAYGEGEKAPLAGVKVKNVVTGVVSDLKVSGLFFAIGHEPATKFLSGQLELDTDGYVVTEPGSTKTSVKGVFAAGDVQDKKYRQAITAAGSGLFIIHVTVSDKNNSKLTGLLVA